MLTLEYNITITCPFCGKDHSVAVFADEYNAWNAGALAQDAFKSLNATQREQIISHICPKCQEEVFGQDTGSYEEDDPEINTILIYDYNDEGYEVEMPAATKFLQVTVLSGDEIVKMFDKDMKLLCEYDACPNGRMEDFYDGSYIIKVDDEDFNDWLGRSSSYNKWQINSRN